MLEMFKLYNQHHFEHIRFNASMLEEGVTTVNGDKPVSQRVVKNGNAPCEVLQYASQWKQKEQAERDLQALGFERKNEIVWLRSV